MARCPAAHSSWIVLVDGRVDRSWHVIWEPDCCFSSGCSDPAAVATSPAAAGPNIENRCERRRGSCICTVGLCLPTTVTPGNPRGLGVRNSCVEACDIVLSADLSQILAHDARRVLFRAAMMLCKPLDAGQAEHCSVHGIVLRAVPLHEKESAIDWHCGVEPMLQAVYR